MKANILEDIKTSSSGKKFIAANKKDSNAHLYRYQTGRDTPIKIKQPLRSRGRRAAAKNYILKEKKLFAVEALVGIGGFTIEDAINLVRAFNTLTQKSSLGNSVRHSVNRDGIFKVMEPSHLDKYFVEYAEDDEELGYVASDGGEKDIALYLNEYVDTKFWSTVDMSRTATLLYMELKVSDFKNMTVAEKIRVLKYTHTIINDIIYVNKYPKKDFGNNGRTYETIFEFPKTTRHHFNIYGWDLEAALQNIWYQDCKKISPDSEFPITLELITNKTKFRKKIARYVFADFAGKKALGKAKTFITKIYQGFRTYKGLNEAGRVWLEAISSEADAMMKLMVEDALKNRGDERTKYAIKRTNMKMVDKNYYINAKLKQFLSVDKINEMTKAQKFKMDKSLVFYLWTYNEQRIMEVIERRIKNPIDLLDARYTQNVVEYEELNKVNWSRLILEETGYVITVGTEIYTTK